MPPSPEAGGPLVLIASVSPYERRSVASSLEGTGFATRTIDDAGEAARLAAANGGSCLLVIDSGLLEAPHDPQWRSLRAVHPHLGAVVRCLIPHRGCQRADDRTLLVHPDDEEGLRQAARVLASGRLAAPQA